MKKILSLILCLALALGMIPAFAEEAAAPRTAEAYIMYANSGWDVAYWNNDGEETVVVPTNAEITGDGAYTVALDFSAVEGGVDTAFNALGVKGGIEAFPGMCLKITAIRINGEAVDFVKGYTNDEDGRTRMNIYNEWAAPGEGARSWDGDVTDASAVMVAKEKFTGVTKMEVDFEVITLKDEAYIALAAEDWGPASYWNDGAETTAVATNATVDGEGTYTVKLEYAEPLSGAAFAALVVKTGSVTFPGWFIDVKEVKVNGEAIETGKGYTSSDNGIEMRSNLHNPWVDAASLPVDARRADGNLEGATAQIVPLEAFAGATSIEVTFDFIYGEPPAKEEAMTEDEAKALKEAGFHAYIGVQGKDTYVFRNAWNDNYGLNDTEHPYFNRLTGWDNPDTEDGSDDLGGTFQDTEIKGDGTYTVSLTTGERGFGATQAFNLLFVSTDIPSKLIEGGFLTISDVKVKIGSAAAQEFTNVNTEDGDYARIDLINTYTLSEDAFGYTVPGANETIEITFTVSGW